jgi:hypothetical protein
VPREIELPAAVWKPLVAAAPGSPLVAGRVEAAPLPPEPRPQAPTEPAPVMVTIGRVDVRALVAPGAKPDPGVRGIRRLSAPSLEDYLAGRHGAARR